MNARRARVRYATRAALLASASIGLASCANPTATQGSRRSDAVLGALRAYEDAALAAASADCGGDAASESESAHRKRHPENVHHINFSVGIDDETHTEGGYRAGIDYEYHFTPLWGVGLAFDRTVGRIDESMLAIPLIAHPLEHLGLVLAPGYVFRFGAGDSYALRTGVFYEIELGSRLALTPALYYDFLENGVRSTIVTLGLGIGF